MTSEMFLGGLMILTMVAGVVIVMTSTRDSDSDGSADRENRR